MPADKHPLPTPALPTRPQRRGAWPGPAGPEPGRGRRTSGGAPGRRGGGAPPEVRRRRAAAGVGEAQSADATRTRAALSSARDGAASLAFGAGRGGTVTAGPLRWPVAPWGPGCRRDEAQQSGGGTVHRFGAGFHPVVPRGERLLKSRGLPSRPGRGPAWRPPRALLTAHGGRRAPGFCGDAGRRRLRVACGCRAREAPEQGEAAAGGVGPALPLPLAPSDCPHPRARPVPASSGAGGPKAPFRAWAPAFAGGALFVPRTVTAAAGRRLPAWEAGGTPRGLARLRWLLPPWRDRRGRAVTGAGTATFAPAR